MTPSLTPVAPREAVIEAVAAWARHQQGRAALRAMQDNDTRAYTEAEVQLTEAQKPRARELVSQEREKLFQQHEALQERLGD